MLESKAYKTYHAYATGEKIPKPKYVKNKADPESSPKKKSAQASEGKRLKTSAKVIKPAKKKQLATTSKEKGLNVLSEVALFEAEQIKLATKKSLIQTHNSHANGLGADEGTGVIPGVPNVHTYNSDDEQISWKSSDKEDDDEVNVSEDDDDQNDGNADNKDKEDKEEEWSDDEAYDDETQGVNVEGEELDKEETNEEDEGNELYRDVNVDVLVSTNVEMPPSYVTSLPPPPITFIQPQQQTDVPTPTIVPSTSLQNLLTFYSLFKFKDRVKALEDNFSEFKQTNQFVAAVSSIPSIVDTYLANKVNEAVKALEDEAQAENEDFINTLDENMRKIIKKQVKEQVKEQVSKILPKIEKFVNDQLEAKVLTRSSNQAKTSHAVAANLSELELKKILIDKIENNKSINRSIQQKTLYKALVDGYETEKDILETYRDIVTFKRQHKSTSAPKEKTSKSTGKSKEGSKSHQKSIRKSAQAEKPIHVDEDLEEPAHQEFDTGITENQLINETTQHHDWFQKPTKPQTPDRDWNKTFPA
ncbi:hypothetical protein Tco_1525580 [Tanacetum coccineum]